MHDRFQNDGGRSKKLIRLEFIFGHAYYFNFIFTDLASKGINNLLIEVGAKLSTILLSLNLIDNLIIYRSGKIIGNDGLPFINDLNNNCIEKLKNYKISFVRTLDDDVLEIRNHSNEA